MHYYGKKWDDVIFSDEKKFNLDGSNGFRYFWYDIRKEKEIFSKCTFGGGSVMVWGSFETEGATPIVFVQGRMNSESYVDILADNLLPETLLITSGDYLLQQDNASVHVSRTSKSWFDANFVKLLDWPTRTPDLNPMENLWGILAHEVYKNGIQYQNKQELTYSVEKAWIKISKNVLKELSNSMTSRLIKVIEKKGEIINY
ncbi:Transposable element Tc3 transposase [Araneus ventricosus]|uniref:Transposable element Tc3 transposase n=1 Tax=Araneus ventricosus TaxID=182803 RepID=A0A4Y2J6V9_ARAVE|nr:Transposable element Tc3 transposase [Araneus ventricosus]